MGWTVLARLIETHIWGSLLALWWEGTAKEQLFCLGESFPFSARPKTDNPVVLCMSQALLWSCWPIAEAQIPRVQGSLCEDSWRRMPWTPAALCLTQPSSLLVFTARVMGTSLPNTGTLGWRTWCGAGTPHFSGGLPSQNSSQFLTISHKCGTRPFLFYTFPTNLTETSSLYL